MRSSLFAIIAFAAVQDAVCSPAPVVTEAPVVTPAPILRRGLGQEQPIIPVTDGQNTEYLGVDTDYLAIAKIGKNTEWLTEEDSTTKWIGVNTEYLTDEITTTSNGQTITTDVPAGASVSVDDSGAKLNMFLSPKVISTFEDVSKTACGAMLKNRKRSASCALDFLEALPSNDDLNLGLERLKDIDAWIQNGGFSDQLLKLHGISQEGWDKLITVGASKAMQRYYALALAGFTAYQLAGKIDFNLEWDLGKNIDVTTTEVSVSQTSTQSSSSSSACPTATDAPICRDNECKGDDKDKCTEGENKDCDCIPQDTEYVHMNDDADFYDEEPAEPEGDTTVTCVEGSKYIFRFTGAAASGLTGLAPTDAEKAVAAFCKSTREIDPTKEDSSHGFAIGSTGNGGYYGEFKLQVTTRVALQVGWSEDQDGCDEKKTFNLSDISDCSDILLKVNSDCDKDSPDTKFGATIHQKRDVGCVNFDIRAITNYETWTGTI